MNRITIIAVIFLIVPKGFAQMDSISLTQCLLAAREKSAVNGQSKIVEDIAALKMTNARVSYLPSVSAYGKAWYQSDAVTVTGPTGPMIEVDRFQYNTGLEADQPIYDGGLSKHRRELERAIMDSEEGKIEMELYQLNSLLTDLYFNSVLIDKKNSAIQLKIDVLTKRLKEVEAAVNAGLVKGNQVDEIKVELLSSQQQQLEIEKLRQQTITSLSLYTGLDIQFGTTFILSDIPEIYPSSIRPEYKYFDAEMNRLESMSDLQKGKKLPHIGAYGQAGYSYPGLNFFENEPAYYYIVGARLSWNIFDWKQNKRDTEVLLKQKEIIETKKTDFEQKIEIAMKKELIEQQKLSDIIKIDEELIRQRTAVTKASETSLLQGVITSTDYLEDLNAEINARINLETHKTQLQESLIQYELLKGIDTINLVVNNN